MRADSISWIQGKWPCRPFFLWQLYGVQEEKKALSGHTLKILSLYLVALTLYSVYSVYKDLEDMKSEGLPALFCIFYQLVCQVISVFKLENPTSET